MRILVAIAALLLGIAPALAQQANETDGDADVLNALMLKATDRCYALARAERTDCCRQFFNRLCEDTGAPALAQTPPAAPAGTSAAPSAQPEQPAAAPRRATTQARGLSSGDGPARALNIFVMKEITQCRSMTSAREQRACCEKIMHPNACAQ